MRSQLVVLVGILSSTTCFGLSSTFAADPSARQAQPVLGQEFQTADEIAIREKFGLNTSEETLKLAANSDRNRNLLGIALTKEEIVEIEDRDALAPIAQQLQDDPTLRSKLAGIWIDQQGGGKLIVATTADAAIDPSSSTERSAVEQEVRSRIVAMDQSVMPRLEFRMARYSLVHLEQIQAELSDRVGRPPGQITGAGIDSENNVVRLTILDTAPASLVASLRNQYQDAVRVVRANRRDAYSLSTRTANPPPGAIDSEAARESDADAAAADTVESQPPLNNSVPAPLSTPSTTGAFAGDPRTSGGGKVFGGAYITKGAPHTRMNVLRALPQFRID